MKKFQFILIKRKKIIVIVLCFLFILSICLLPKIIISTTPKSNYIVVLDAGHGGIDGGCEGTSDGSNERELNLLYAKTLKRYFEEYGFNVVMTRTTTDGLYSAFASNKKKDDMQKRKAIIENTNPNFILSLHMNAFPQKSVRGAQVYYNPENEISKELATSIQNCFFNDLPCAKYYPAVGDYYLLNCTNIPSVIIECGFLSNLEEEQLLLSDQYREKVCYSILCGVVKYLE